VLIGRALVSPGAVFRSESICHVTLHAHRAPLSGVVMGSFYLQTRAGIRVQGCASLLIKDHPLSFFHNLFTKPIAANPISNSD
jgi:hypothetical protein